MKRAAMILGVAAVLAFAGLAQAGRLLGPGIDAKTAPAFGSVTYYETFRGGEEAVVSIVGDGATDLDVFVYDRFGNLVTSATGPTDRETVR
jgi:hypothetical protein